jgi:hypothetical protein
MTTITDAQIVAALQAWYRTEPAMSQWMPVVKDRMRRSLEAAQEEGIAERMVEAIARSETSQVPPSLAAAIPILEAELKELDDTPPSIRLIDSARIVIAEAKGLLVDVVYHGEPVWSSVPGVTDYHVVAAPPKLSLRQQMVLRTLFDDYNSDYVYYTRLVATYAGLTESYTRKALRALVRKGLAELVRGLQSEEDGHLMGSGYRLTDAGRKRAESK